MLKYRLVDTGPTDQDFGKALTALFSGIARITLSKDPGTKLGDDMNTGNIIALAAEDGRQAVRLVRRRASELGVSPDRIGIMGFSAGGLVTDEVALHHDAESRPNFAAPIYGAPFGAFSVPADAPSLFILCANDDGLSALGSARLYAAWKAAGKPAELHIYAKGGHGFGMRKQHLPTDTWIDRLGDWLEAQGLLKLAR